MGSRLRVNPSHLIECWCEVVGPQGDENSPWIIQKFPRTFEEEEVLKSIPQFTFPCTFEKYQVSLYNGKRVRSAVQHFSFVLTNLESKFLYGFCRHAPDAETAIVVMSHLPWHELFYKVLNQCSSLVCDKESGDLWSFLQNLYQVPVPAPGTKLSVTYGDNKYFVAECPNHLSLPSIPENRNLSEYFSAVDIDNMMIIFASMLNERRIIVTSDRLSRLSACVQAANSLIYPMSWQHIFIPVLPQHLIDYLHAPMPFLIGISWSLLKKVNRDDMGDIVTLNADTNKITTPHNDLLSFPDEVVSSLRKSLSPSNNLLGDSVSRAFLKALVQLIGNYREALLFREEDRRISFNEEKFVSQRPHHLQPFVERMLQLQIFRQFIEERVDLLNSGLHTSDEFELEASVYGDRSSSKMKQIFSNVKKESGAIMKNVKNKTNPAMKSAVKSVTKSGKNVREKSKITYREIRGKFKDRHHGYHHKSTESSDGSSVNGDAVIKPRSAPSSPTQPPRRSKNKATSGLYDGYNAKASYRRVSPTDLKLIINEHKTVKQNLSSDSQKTPSPQEIDLIGELEDVLKTQFATNFGSCDFSSRKCVSTTSLGSICTSQQETGSTVSMSTSLLGCSSSNGSSVSGGNPFGDTVPFSQIPPPSLPNGIQNRHSTGDSLNTSDSKQRPSGGTVGSLDLSLDISFPPPLFPQQKPSISSHNFHVQWKNKFGQSSPKFSNSSQYTCKSYLKMASEIPYTSFTNTDNSSSPNYSPFNNIGLSTSPVTNTDHFHSPKHVEESNSSHRNPNWRPKAYTLPCSSTTTSTECPISHSIHRAVEPQIVRTTTASTPNVFSFCSDALRSNFPKYEASPAFSASLARFSSQESNANYFFSFLSRRSSKSTDSLTLDSEDFVAPNQNNFNICPPDVLTEPAGALPKKSSPLPCPKPSTYSFDIMTMSLPPGLNSIWDLPMHGGSSFPNSNGGRDPFPKPIMPPPRSRRRRKQIYNPESARNNEDGSKEDLLFMESPQEEEFDPLVAKDVPPPIPARHQRNSKGNVSKKDEEPSVNVEGERITPKRLSPTRYLPFSSLQNGLKTNAVQNPVYNQHQPPFAQVSASSLGFSRNFPVEKSFSLSGNVNNMIPKPYVAPGNTSNGAAQFAATMIPSHLNSNNVWKSPLGFTNSLHNMSGHNPVTSQRFPNDVCSGPQKTSSGAQNLTEKDLLGDFTSGFQNLSVSSKEKKNDG